MQRVDTSQSQMQFSHQPLCQSQAKQVCSTPPVNKQQALLFIGQ